MDSAGITDDMVKGVEGVRLSEEEMRGGGVGAALISGGRPRSKLVKGKSSFVVKTVFFHFYVMRKELHLTLFLLL